ncbi:MAG: hypothetical protein IT306_09295 [Chloroflexi bacterium]|nr:hypothetical protein [Chloroflexota bacterium]
MADLAYQRVLRLAPDGQLQEIVLPDPVEPRTTEQFGQTIVETELTTALGSIAVGGGYLYIYSVSRSGTVSHIFPARSQLKRISLRTGASRLLSTAGLSPLTPGTPIARPHSMAADRSGTLYVTEYSQYGGAIHVLSPDGDAIDHWRSQEWFGKLFRPGLITFGADGLLYVSEHGGWLIRAYTTDGTPLGDWTISQAGGIAVDQDGAIYATGGGWQGSGQIQKLAPTGETIARIGAPADAPGTLILRWRSDPSQRGRQGECQWRSRQALAACWCGRGPVCARGGGLRRGSR